MTTSTDDPSLFFLWRDALGAAQARDRLTYRVEVERVTLYAASKRISEHYGPDALGYWNDDVDAEHIVYHPDRVWTVYGGSFYFDTEEDAVAARLLIS
jgi:hypothetical protein